MYAYMYIFTHLHISIRDTLSKLSYKSSNSMRLSTIMSYINIPQYIYKKKKMSMFILFLSIISIYTLQSCKLFYFK